jgi:SAM-dependent methyltransferase
MLDIGCARGVHLAGLAFSHPEATYLGVDLDERAIRDGRETLAALDLRGVTLEVGDFRALAQEKRRFDYVVAHGMYSWLPEPMRGELLSVIAATLDDQGVAMVSFNALPGGFTRSSLGDFVFDLERHGLAYLTDAGTLDRSPLAAHPLVKGLEASPIERLETVDRLEMCRFRQAVVCRADASNEMLDFARAEKLWFVSSAEPAARGNVLGAEPVRFKTVSGLELETNVGEIKLALYELGRVWPEALRLDDLAERVSERRGSVLAPGALASSLLESAAGAVVRVRATRPRSVRAPSASPSTTPLARLEASRGVAVTNLHHEPVNIDVPFHRALLALLDGNSDREELARALSDQIEARAFAVPGIDPGARSRWEGIILREVDAGVERLARYALLVG